MELPGKARILLANPTLSFYVSNIPTNAVKKALPNTIAFVAFGRSAIYV